ncbi:MAG: hypothetical protein FWH21_03020 [Kiritimatiellaeota bacterium]|nr:hypothetical protein [Kiritimatiellota bacterium]
MNFLTGRVCAAIAMLGGAATAEELVPIQTVMPKPSFGIGPKDMSKEEALVPIQTVFPKPPFGSGLRDIKNAYNLEPPRNGKSYPPILVPKGCDELLSRGCMVTSSDPWPVKGKLSFVTDGEKEAGAETSVELAPGRQWVQIDLGSQKEIYAVWIWHFFSQPCVYKDVIVQVSDDPDFIDGVVTVFNNDHDNSAGLGAGKDFEYIEMCRGRPIPANGAKGRYVRCTSGGDTTTREHIYTEVEVFGKK